MASPPTISEPSLPGRTAGFTAEELDATELAAQVAIHRLGLCRWQAIDVLRLPGRGIRIRGVVERSEQIADLRSALAGVSAIEFELAAPPEDMATVPSDIQMRTRLEPRPPLLERRLEQYFLGQAPRDQVARSIAEFCGRAVELAATAHSEAQALNTLAGAFSEACLQRMSAADRARFLPVAEEHIRELRQSLAQLRVLLDRLEDGSASVEPAPLPSKWEDGCHLVALRTARMDLLIGGLFAGLDLHGLTAGQAWRELRETQERSVVLLDAAGLSLRGSLETGNR